MYEVFYNLKAEPFRLSPDHRFCFEHKGYAKARAYMAYAFKRAEGFVMVTGRPGTGKTTLIGELVESLSRDKVFTANLVCTQLSADDLLKSVAYSFGIGSAKLDKAELLQRLTILFHRWHREGRRALLIVDEAQDLSSSAMEELRLLTNIQIGGQPLLQIFLLGQPELRDLILSTAMEQVHQRIVAASHIDELEEEETEAYVMHRLLAVGWNGDPAIDRAIFPLIHKFSEGVPRRINLICSRLFLLGSVEQRHAIELEDVRVVISELQAENLAAGTGYSPQEFQASGSPEWVPVPLATGTSQPDSHPPAANSEPFFPPADAPLGTAFGTKKKDLSKVAAISDADPASIAIGPSAFDSHGETEPEEDPYAQISYEGGEWVSDLRWMDGDGGEESIAGSTDRSIKSGFGRRRRTALLVLVIVTIVVTASVAAYFVRQERQASSGYESDAQVLVRAGGQQPASSNATPVADLIPAPQLPVAEGLESPTSASPMPAESSASLRVASESMVRQAPQSATEHQVVVNEIAEESVATAVFEQASANLTEDEISASTQDAATASEQYEQVFLVSFAFDSDELLPESNQALDSALERLREEPDTVASITGFTDSQGDESYNLALSRKRATAVEKYLVEEGVVRQRLYVEGRGVLNSPIGTQLSDAEEEMEPYRIVEIKLSTENSQ